MGKRKRKILMKKNSKKTKSSVKKSSAKIEDLKPKKNPKGGAYTTGGSVIGQRVVRQRASSIE